MLKELQKHSGHVPHMLVSLVERHINNNGLVIQIILISSYIHTITCTQFFSLCINTIGEGMNPPFLPTAIVFGRHLSLQQCSFGFLCDAFALFHVLIRVMQRNIRTSTQPLQNCTFLLRRQKTKTYFKRLIKWGTTMLLKTYRSKYHLIPSFGNFPKRYSRIYMQRWKGI